MKYLFSILAFVIASSAYGQSAFGVRPTADGAIPANALAAKMKGVDSLTVKVTGTVTNVCQRKGCWLQMDIGEGKTMRVRFKDYAFFVPKNISGKTVVLDGYAYNSTTSVAQLRHYAHDAGLSKAEINRITEPQVDVVYEARGVLIVQ